jgi:hypothetical protein
MNNKGSLYIIAYIHIIGRLNKMKKILNLLLISGAFILASCEKDVITTYAVVDDERVSVRFQSYGHANAVSPARPDPEGSNMALSGVERILVTGDGYAGAEISVNEEVKLKTGQSYSLTWSYYDTSSPAELKGNTSVLWLNYVNRPNAVTVYLGDEASDVIPIQN